MTNVVNIREDYYRLEEEIAGKVEELIHQYDGRVSLVTAIGVLELVKLALYEKAGKL